MPQNPTISLDVDTLPLDVFELAANGLEVESLTAGHGMPENGASYADAPKLCACSCYACRVVEP